MDEIFEESVDAGLATTSYKANGILTAIWDIAEQVGSVIKLNYSVKFQFPELEDGVEIHYITSDSYSSVELTELLEITTPEQRAGIIGLQKELQSLLLSMIRKRYGLNGEYDFIIFCI